MQETPTPCAAHCASSDNLRLRAAFAEHFNARDYAAANVLVPLLFPNAFRKDDTIATDKICTWSRLLQNARERKDDEALLFLHGCLQSNAMPTYIGITLFPADTTDEWWRFATQELAGMQPPSDAASLQAWRTVITNRVIQNESCATVDNVVAWLCSETGCDRPPEAKAAVLRQLVDPPALLRRLTDPLIIRHVQAPDDALLSEAQHILSPEEAHNFNATAIAKCDELLRKLTLFGPRCTVGCVDDLLQLARPELEKLVPGILARHIAGTAHCVYMDPCSAASHARLRENYNNLHAYRLAPTEFENVLKFSLDFLNKNVRDDNNVAHAAALLAQWKYNPTHVLEHLCKTATDSGCRSTNVEALSARSLLTCYLKLLQPLHACYAPGVLRNLRGKSGTMVQPVALAIGDVLLPFMQAALVKWNEVSKGEPGAHMDLYSTCQDIFRLFIAEPTCFSRGLSDLLCPRSLLKLAQHTYMLKADTMRHIRTLLDMPHENRVVANFCNKGWPVRACAAMLVTQSLHHVHKALAIHWWDTTVQDHENHNWDPVEDSPVSPLRAAMDELRPGMNTVFQILDRKDGALAKLGTLLDSSLRARTLAALMYTKYVERHPSEADVWSALVGTPDSPKLQQHEALCTLLAESWRESGQQALFVTNILRDFLTPVQLTDHRMWQSALSAVDRDEELMPVLEDLTRFRRITITKFNNAHMEA